MAINKRLGSKYLDFPTPCACSGGSSAGVAGQGREGAEMAKHMARSQSVLVFLEMRRKNSFVLVFGRRRFSGSVTLAVLLLRGRCQSGEQSCAVGPVPGRKSSHN